MKADKEFAEKKIKELDQWCQGLIFGAISATLFWAGLVWTMMEPIR